MYATIFPSTQSINIDQSLLMIQRSIFFQEALWIRKQQIKVKNNAIEILFVFILFQV